MLIIGYFQLVLPPCAYIRGAAQEELPQDRRLQGQLSQHIHQFRLCAVWPWPALPCSCTAWGRPSTRGKLCPRRLQQGVLCSSSSCSSCQQEGRRVQALCLRSPRPQHKFHRPPPPSQCFNLEPGATSHRAALQAVQAAGLAQMLGMKWTAAPAFMLTCRW